MSHVAFCMTLLLLVELAAPRYVNQGRSEGRAVPDNQGIPKRITARPDEFGPNPIIRDKRTTVGLVLSLLSQGATQAETPVYYPDLEPDDTRPCRAYPHTAITGDSLALV